MSARENITLGRPDASDEDIAAAIETAQASFVYDLPWGLDTRIGEQGMSLSGGQRQRLALARAVLARAARSSSSTTRCPRSTSTPRRWSRRRCAGAGRGHRHRRRAPCVDGAAGRPGGPAAGRHDHSRRHSHHELLATVPAYHDLLAGDADEDSWLAARAGGLR